MGVYVRLWVPHDMGSHQADDEHEIPMDEPVHMDDLVGDFGVFDIWDYLFYASGGGYSREFCVLFFNS